MHFKLSPILPAITELTSQFNQWEKQCFDHLQLSSSDSFSIAQMELQPLITKIQTWISDKIFPQHTPALRNLHTRCTNLVSNLTQKKLNEATNEFKKIKDLIPKIPEAFKTEQAVDKEPEIKRFAASDPWVEQQDPYLDLLQQTSYEIDLSQQQNESNKPVKKAKKDKYVGLLKSIFDPERTDNIDPKLQKYAIELAPTSITISLGLAQLIDDDSVRQTTLTQIQQLRSPKTVKSFLELYSAFLQQLNSIHAAVMKLPRRTEAFSYLNQALSAAVPPLPQEFVIPERVASDLLSQVMKIAEASDHNEGAEALQESLAINGLAITAMEEGNYSDFVEFVKSIGDRNIRIQTGLSLIYFLFTKASKEKALNLIVLVIKQAQKEGQLKYISQLAPLLAEENPEFASNLLQSFDLQVDKFPVVKSLNELSTFESVQRLFPTTLTVWHALQQSLPFLGEQQAACAALLKPIASGEFFIEKAWGPKERKFEFDLFCFRFARFKEQISQKDFPDSPASKLEMNLLLNSITFFSGKPLFKGFTPQILDLLMSFVELRKQFESKEMTKVQHSLAEIDKKIKALNEEIQKFNRHDSSSTTASNDAIFCRTMAHFDQSQELVYWNPNSATKLEKLFTDGLMDLDIPPAWITHIFKPEVLDDKGFQYVANIIFIRWISLRQKSVVSGHSIPTIFHPVISTFPIDCKSVLVGSVTLDKQSPQNLIQFHQIYHCLIPLWDATIKQGIQKMIDGQKKQDVVLDALLKELESELKLGVENEKRLQQDIKEMEGLGRLEYENFQKFVRTPFENWKNENYTKLPSNADTHPVHIAKALDPIIGYIQKQDKSFLHRELEKLRDSLLSLQFCIGIGRDQDTVASKVIEVEERINLLTTLMNPKK